MMYTAQRTPTKSFTVVHMAVYISSVKNGCVNNVSC